MPPPEPLRTSYFEALRDLAREGPVEVIVRGSCMAPRVTNGERVQVAAVRFCWPGDLVAFQAGDGRLRLHRMLGYRPWKGGIALITRGDGCPCHDGPVPLGRILGRVARPVRLADRLRAGLAALRLALR
jgi:hypothetical protein